MIVRFKTHNALKMGGGAYDIYTGKLSTVFYQDFGRACSSYSSLHKQQYKLTDIALFIKIKEV